jgi:hypothetical protein
MPIIENRLCTARQRPQYVSIRKRSRRTAHSPSSLDTSIRLIAPAHGLTLPTLKGVKERFSFSFGSGAALPLTRALLERGLLREKHLQAASSPVSALEAAMRDFLDENFGESKDEFDVTLCISDSLEDYRKPEDVLFLNWSHATDPQYIPLRPVSEKLNGNPYREQLMGSLYQWLYHSASRVFDVFGFDQAKNVYAWRKECYTEARENGEDVDMEGELEAADPAKVVSYIRNSEELLLKGKNAAVGIESISDNKLRIAFEAAHRLYTASRKIKLPSMAEDCRRTLDDAAYYMDAYPIPALGISHWRDDPIVAWFDEFCQEQFESGASCRAPILLCFRPDDRDFFLEIIGALPAMVRTVRGLSEWVRFAQELENASDYGNREQA